MRACQRFVFAERLVHKGETAAPRPSCNAQAVRPTTWAGGHRGLCVGLTPTTCRHNSASRFAVAGPIPAREGAEMLASFTWREFVGAVIVLGLALIPACLSEPAERRTEPARDGTH